MHTAAERPDLWERGIESADVWPEYNLHGDVLNQWWGLLDEELADLQFVLHDDETDTVVAEGHTGAFVWDGDDATPAARASTGPSRSIFRDHRAGTPVNTLCALAAESPRDGRRRGLAVEILGAMRTHRRAARPPPPGRPGAPVVEGALPRSPRSRSTSAWRRADGQLLDPWMRVHERLGARVSTPLPESLLITGHRRGVGVLDRAAAAGRAATSSSPKGSRRCTSTSTPTGRPTGSRTSGWCTPTSRAATARAAASGCPPPRRRWPSARTATASYARAARGTPGRCSCGCHACPLAPVRLTQREASRSARSITIRIDGTQSVS